MQQFICIYLNFLSPFPFPPHSTLDQFETTIHCMHVNWILIVEEIGDWNSIAIDCAMFSRLTVPHHFPHLLQNTRTPPFIHLPHSVEAIIRSVDGQHRGPSVRFGHAPIPFEDDHFGPNLVIDLSPFVQNLLNVLLKSMDGTKTQNHSINSFFFHQKINYSKRVQKGVGRRQENRRKGG